MRVTELIDKLKGVNPDAEVWAIDITAEENNWAEPVVGAFELSKNELLNEPGRFVLQIEWR